MMKCFMEVRGVIMDAWRVNLILIAAAFHALSHTEARLILSQCTWLSFPSAPVPAWRASRLCQTQPRGERCSGAFCQRLPLEEGSGGKVSLSSAFGASLLIMCAGVSDVMHVSLCVLLHSWLRPGRMPSCPSPTRCTITPPVIMALTAEAPKHKNDGLYILTLQ